MRLKSSNFHFLRLGIFLMVSANLICAVFEANAQAPRTSMSFESLDEISSSGGVVAGAALEIVPGLTGNAVSLQNSDSLCFPAANILQTPQGTLQFWVKDVPSSGGIWEVTNVGANKLWGTYRFKDETLNVMHYELQTNVGTFVRSTRDWREDQDWHFLVFNWRQNGARTQFALYVDGVVGALPNLIGQVSLSANSMFCLGGYSNKPKSHAKFDELKTYDYLRSQSEITADFWSSFSGCPIWPYLWRNPFNGADVNRDSVVNKLDALLILSAIASGEIFDFTICPNGQIPTLAYDVLGDNVLTILDAAAVVNTINAPLPPAERISLSTLELISHGDANGDGVLSGADITYMLERLDQSVEIFTNGDANGDGLVNSLDITILRKYLSLSANWRDALPLFKVNRP